MKRSLQKIIQTITMLIKMCKDKIYIYIYRKDFSLNSGERQISNDLSGIRKDHVYRYELACAFIKAKFANKNIIGADIFCGNGYGSFIIANNISTICLLSIDASREAIQLAKKHYSVKDRIEYQTRFFPFVLQKDTYDLIISFESIEHVKDDNAFIETLVYAIKDGGYLFLSTPNDEILSLEKNPNKFHYKHYTSHIINNICEKYHLEIINKYGQDTYKIDDNGIVCGILEEENMDLIRDYNGQFMIYILKVSK